MNQLTKQSTHQRTNQLGDNLTNIELDRSYNKTNN
jgi:hypothetical protein